MNIRIAPEKFSSILPHSFNSPDCCTYWQKYEVNSQYIWVFYIGPPAETENIKFNIVLEYTPRQMAKNEAPYLLESFDYLSSDVRGFCFSCYCCCWQNSKSIIVVRRTLVVVPCSISNPIQHATTYQLLRGPTIPSGPSGNLPPFPTHTSIWPPISSYT
jgi:hypothetical protein